MGLQIGEIIPRKEISFAELKDKIIAIDAFNTIYQFLSTIRQVDGTPLMDSKKRITSHLSGLFYRSTNLLTQGIKLIYVFDGVPPKLKGVTKERRTEQKEKAKVKYEEAKKRKDIEEMGKYAKQLTMLSDEMIKESKNLLKALGIPVVQAPSEGEAQAAFMCKTNKDIYATASQDYDALLFNSPKLIQNLTLARKRRTSTGIYIPIHPELIELQKVLNSLQITQEQLICLSILVGTDYNPKGIVGIGPKKALQFVRQHKQPALIFRQFPEAEFDWQEIFSLFKQPKVTKNYKIKFSSPSKEAVKKILCKEHDFSEERVDSALGKLEKAKEEQKQSQLEKWF